MLNKIWRVLLVGLVVALTSRAAVATPPLRLAYVEFPPFHWTAEDGRLTGFFYDIITEALTTRLGVPLVWTAYPWNRCQENVKTGTDDALLTVPTAERLAYTVTNPNPFYMKLHNLFTYRDHPRLEEIMKIKKLTDLKKGGFSVITYSGNGWHKEHVASLGIETQETSQLENVWRMLAEKRGDIVIEWPPGAWPVIDRASVKDRVIDTNIGISEVPFHLLIRKGSSHVTLLPAFNSTIQEMKADGTMAGILAKYY